ncbi:MAG: acyltransferase [Erysipelotrichaceae bacterium]|nr:acyltransferase [Erysipelotrichaceae bacterium]
MSLKTDHILLLLFLIVVAFSRIRTRDEKKDYLSIENCTLIKGFLAINVVLCHLGLLYKGEGRILDHYEFLGAISVGVFFFLSGYALMFQYLKKVDYHVGFLNRRFGKVFIPYLIVTVVYMIYANLTGHDVGPIEVFMRFLTDDPLVSYSWYICEVMVLYLFFYVSMKMCKTQKAVPISNTIFYICLIFFYKACNFRTFWCDSTHMFVIGIMWAYYKEKITEIVSRFDLIILLLSVLFLILVNTKSTIFSRVAYLFVFIVFFMRFDYKNRFLTFTGKISMEMYMLHGLAFQIVRRFLFDDGGFICLFTSFVVIYILSFVFNRFFRILIRKLSF